MRSDYYNPLIPTQEPPAPQSGPGPKPARPKRARRRHDHALPLFLLTLALILGGSFWLGRQYDFTMFPLEPLPGWSLPGLPGFDQTGPIPFPAAETPVPATALPAAPLPGERPLEPAGPTEDRLTPNAIHTALSPSILSVSASSADGSGLYTEGTGVLFDDRGYFVTNAHVVEGAGQAAVTLSDGRSYPAFLVGMDKRTDLAVLYFAGTGLTAAPFAWDDTLAVGDPVYAIGNPLGSQFQGSMTDGIVSAIGRSVTVDGYEMSLIQTSAPINTGSSGGALVDAAGRVVGITNLKMVSWYATVEGLGFAIPSSTVEKVVNDLMELGYVAGRPVLGITVRPATAAESASGGLYVDEVDSASDAWEKGLRPGDVLLYANGQPLTQNNDLLKQRTGLAAGESMSLSWLSLSTHSLRTAQVQLIEEHLLAKAP